MTIISEAAQPEGNSWDVFAQPIVDSLLPLPRSALPEEDDDTATQELDFLEGAVEHTEMDTAQEAEQSRVRRWLRAARHTGQAAVAVTVLSPANELICAGIVAAGYAHTHDPAMSALTAGGSTAALELAGAYAAAGLLATEKGGRFFDMLNRKMSKVAPEKLSPVTKATTTLALGTVVGMAIEQAEDPERTVEQNRRYGLLTSAWLAGVVAVGGALGSEGLNAAIEKPDVALPVVGGVVALETGRRVMNKLRKAKSAEAAEARTWKDSDKYCDYRLTSDEYELKDAAIVEQQVWDEKGFGNLEEEGYLPHIERSRTFVAFDKEGNCVGLNRMFVGTEGIVPPFLEMPFDSEEDRAELTSEATIGNIEELGTVALVPEFRGKMVNVHLWRLAYRDALDRGVKQWGIIMEPDRVERMNKNFGFTFRQLGPTENYQGGDCAAFVMDLGDVTQSMRRKKPLQYFWFARKSLKS